MKDVATIVVTLSMNHFPAGGGGEGVKSSKAHLSCFGVVDRKEKGRREFTEWWE